MGRASVVVVLVLVASGLACAEPSSSTQIIGPGGGSVRSDDSRFALHVPPGALAETVEISIARRSDVTALDLDPPIYDVAPLGLRFALPATAELSGLSTTWVGRRALATFDAGTRRELAEQVYQRAQRTLRAPVGDLVRASFGLAVLVEDDPTRCAQLTCGTPCAACDPRDPACTPDPDGPRCSVAGVCAAPEASCPAEGWSDQPGTGRAYVINQIAVAPRGRGFDLDDACRGPGDCVDNATYLIGQLGNDQLRQALLGGEILLMVEVSGASDAFAGASDGSLTVKWYVARDADDPYFPANNFSVPAGESSCCEFLVSGVSMDGSPPNARARFAGRLDRGVIEAHSALGPPLVPFLIIASSTTSDLVPLGRGGLRRARLSARFDGEELAEGMLGGVVTVNDLAVQPNAYCRTLNNLCQRQIPDATMLDLMLVFTRPDMDLDGDGLESVEIGASGRIERCLDGGGAVVPPIEASRPYTCALDPRMADGFSITYTFSGVRATIRGTR